MSNNIFKGENPVILCDVDGVLGDFVGDILKKSGSSLKPEDIQGWNMFDIMKPNVVKKAMQILEGPDFWREQTVLPHAQQEVAKLRERGRVIFVTSPWYSCPLWVDERRGWLKNHFDASDKDMIFTSDKRHVRGDILIDDKFENISDWQDENPNGEARLMDRPYNLGINWAPRVRIGEEGWEYYDGAVEMLTK